MSDTPRIKMARILHRLLHDPNGISYRDLYENFDIKSERALRDYVRELRDLHEEWVWGLNASNTFEHSTEPFPAPPITGTSAIEAIKNGEDLSREGREMRHCVSNYCVSVYAGNNYVYRVLRPERGTLLLANKDGYWSIEEFRLEKNKSPRKESWDCVRNWHDTYHKSFSR